MQDFFKKILRSCLNALLLLLDGCALRSGCALSRLRFASGLHSQPLIYLMAAPYRACIRSRSLRSMSKVLKPVIVILLAVCVAAGGAYYFSRNHPAEGASNAQTPQTTLTQSLGSGGGHWRGPENARLTLVEFGDYQCPSCRAYHPLVLEVLSRYPKDVRLEFHHFPLISIHPNSMAASRAVEAAGEQGKYWEMHDLIFVHQDQWAKNPNPEPDFLAIANQIGLDPNKFMQSMRSPEVQDRILKDVVRARDAKVEVVPTFFIDGQMIDLPPSISEFVKVIDGRLQSKSGGEKTSAAPKDSDQNAKSEK